VGGAQFHPKKCNFDRSRAQHDWLRIRSLPVQQLDDVASIDDGSSSDDEDDNSSSEDEGPAPAAPPPRLVQVTDGGWSYPVDDEGKRPSVSL